MTATIAAMNAVTREIIVACSAGGMIGSRIRENEEGTQDPFTCPCCAPTAAARPLRLPEVAAWRVMGTPQQQPRCSLAPAGPRSFPGWGLGRGGARQPPRYLSRP